MTKIVINGTTVITTNTVTLMIGLVLLTWNKSSGMVAPAFHSLMIREYYLFTCLMFSVQLTVVTISYAEMSIAIAIEIIRCGPHYSHVVSSGSSHWATP